MISCVPLVTLFQKNSKLSWSTVWFWIEPRSCILGLSALLWRSFYVRDCTLPGAHFSPRPCSVGSFLWSKSAFNTSCIYSVFGRKFVIGESAEVVLFFDCCRPCRDLSVLLLFHQIEYCSFKLKVCVHVACNRSRFWNGVDRETTFWC